MSMLSYLKTSPEKIKKITVLYSSKEDPKSGILFLDRLITGTEEKYKIPISNLRLFLTGEQINEEAKQAISPRANVKSGRMAGQDILDEIKSEKTLVYICGPKGMTDEFVDVVKNSGALPEENVFCEKWW